jgi:DNA-binding transcriptional LysR family regulator
VLVCSPRHPLAKESEIDIHHLQYERFIAFEPGVPTRLWIDAIFNRYNLVIRPVMEFDNVETVKRAVEINSGVAILPRTAIAQELASGAIKALEFTNEHFVRPTGIILRKDRVLTPEIKFFVELLRKRD